MAHGNNKSNKHQVKPIRKKMWIIIVVASVFIAIAILVVVFLLLNRQNKISDAYNKCKEEFVAIEGDAEEANINRDDVIIYFKSDTSKESLESMASIMNSFGKVKKVTTSTSEEEYKKLYQEYVNEDNQEMLTTLEIIGKDEMMKKIPAVMHIKAYDSSDLSSIKNVIENNSEFRKYTDNEQNPVYNETPRISFGNLELLDNGKTIMMDIEKGNYADKVSCVCSALNMPDRIKDAIGQTVASDGTRRDEWGNINVEWSYRNEKLHIVIYQK